MENKLDSSSAESLKKSAGLVVVSTGNPEKDTKITCPLRIA